MDCLYNSYNTAYKTPFGAVPAGKPVRFSLTIPESYGFVEPRLVLTQDDGPTNLYQMAFIRVENGINYFSLELSLFDTGLYFYHFDLYSDFRKLYRGAMGQAYLTQADGPRWQLTVYDANFETPDVMKGGVLYQIFPDRFFEGRKKTAMPFADRVYRTDKGGEPYFWPNEEGGKLNLDYFGGDFVGIQQKLPYLQELGVTCIYLNPIFESHANHHYNTADYLNADPLLGTNQEFCDLCTHAKRFGIRIILDGVFSHTGSDSVYFNREGRYGPGGAYHDPNSPYRSWYDFSRNYASGYRCWWGFDSLPEVNENEPSYRSFICGPGGVIDTWMKRGASGFRLDVADELPDSFIQEIRRAVKAHGNDKFLLGEVWEDATTKVAYGQRRNYLLGKGLDSVMNYPFRAAVLRFLRGDPAENLAEDIMSICEHYPAPALHTLMNFVSTHDTERAITAIVGEPCGNHDRYWQSGRRLSRDRYDLGVQLLKLAYVMVYTLPGIPCLYYGDEVAMQGYKDPFNRGYFEWNSTETRMRPLLRRMAQLRSKCDAFKNGDLQVIVACGGLVHYRRLGTKQSVDIAINRTRQLQYAEIPGKTLEIKPLDFVVQVSDICSC